MTIDALRLLSTQLILACLLPTVAQAKHPFVNTRGMLQHAARLQPDYLPLRNLLSAQAELPFVHTPADEEVSALEEVERLPRALKVSVGTLARGRGLTTGVLGGYKDQRNLLVAGVRRDVSKPYTDGQGNEVPFSYQRLSGQMRAKHQLDSKWDTTLDLVSDQWDALRLPNYSMDGNLFDRQVTRLSVQGKRLGPRIAALRSYVESQNLDLRADNYTQRPASPLPLKLDMDRTRYKFRGEADIIVPGLERLTVGIDTSVEHYDSRLKNQANDTVAYRHPDVRTQWSSLYGDLRLKLADHRHLQAGLRYDHLRSAAGNLNQRPNDSSPLAGLFNQTPQELYVRYYGRGSNGAQTDDNLSGRLRLEQDLGQDAGLHLDASRMLRTGSASERWYAVAGVPATTQVGNPNLNAEDHHRFELGGWLQHHAATANSAALWRLETQIWVDQVKNFITADRARGQSGIFMSDGSVIYRNVNAALSGAQVMLSMNPLPSWSGSLRYIHTRGHNHTYNRPLYQMAPDEWDLGVAYHHGSHWHAGALVRYVARQDRVDDDPLTGLGQDTAGPTPSFFTLDLNAGVRLSKGFAATFGISNALNRTYREHVNGLPQSPSTQPVNAPGRTVWLRLIASI